MCHKADPKTTSRALYGMDGSTPIACSVHKVEGMIDLNCIRCRHFGCKTSPSFGPNGARLYCKKHRWDGGLNIESASHSGRLCKIEGCTTSASFGEKGTKQRIRCEKHRWTDLPEGIKELVNTAAIPCKYGKDIGNPCPRPAKYRVNNGPIEWCGTHKPEGNDVRVTGKAYCIKCAAIGVTKKASFGRRYGTIEYCATCCPDRVRYVSRDRKNPHLRIPQCSVNGCERHCYYGQSGYLEPMRCEYHMIRGVDSVLQYFICKMCGFANDLDGDDHCSECVLGTCLAEKREKEGLPKTNPYKSLVEFELANALRETRKKREDALGRALVESGLTVRRDRVAACGCSHYRPDYTTVSDNGKHMVIIECDENQHRFVGERSAYRCDCEFQRMITIMQDFAISTNFEIEGAVFIRYNPDTWTDAKGVKRKHCAADQRRVSRLAYACTKLKNVIGLKITYVCYDGYDHKNEMYTYDSHSECVIPWSPDIMIKDDEDESEADITISPSAPASVNG